MAPSGARRCLACGALVWLLAAQTFAQAEHRSPAVTSPPCNRIDALFENALGLQQNTTSLSSVTLYDGCNALTRNFVCSPIRRSLVINGMDGGTSVWDTGFDMFQFSVETGVVLTLRNMVLDNALVFTVGYNNMQPALFHVPSGGRLALENVTIVSLCATSTYYWTQQQSSTWALGPLTISELTKGSISLRNVTLACNESVVPPTPVDLYVHSANLFTDFASAASALTLTAKISLMQNITLPNVPKSYNPDDPDPRITLVTTDIDVEPYAGTDAARADGSNSSAAAPLTYIDCNYTLAWMYIMPPSRVTLRRLLLTRLRADLWTPGVLSGVLAGAIPLYMIGTPSSLSAGSSSPRRIFEDVVLAVPRYEVTQVSYWCTMLSVMAPEVVAASNFLRSLVWSLDCSVQAPTRVYLHRMRIASTLFTRVTLTSTPPEGVPFDPQVAPPAGSSAYEQVTPPLFIVSSSAEWVEAAAPISPQDTWASPPPTSRASGAGQSPPPQATAATGSTTLPSLILLNGIVSLNAMDLVLPGGDSRVVRRSAVITCMRLGCTAADGGCAPCVLDMVGRFEALRMEGPNTTVVFQDMTLRNVASTIMLAGNTPSAVQGFFSFNRSSVHVVYERCTVELLPQYFSEFYRALSPAGRVNLSAFGELAVMSMTTNLIQVASFQMGGVRGSYVNFTPAATTGDYVIVTAPDILIGASGSTDSGSGSSVSPAAVVGACVGGGIAAGLLIAVAAWLLLTRRRRGAWGPYTLRSKTAVRADSEGQGGDGRAHGGRCSGVGGDTSCLTTVEMQAPPRASADYPEAGSTVTAARAGGAACARYRSSEDRFDVESGPCGTGSTMSMDSSGDPTLLRAAVGQPCGTPLNIPTGAASGGDMALDALPAITARSARRRSSGLFSLPEPHTEREVVIGRDTSLSSSGGAAGVGSSRPSCKGSGVAAPIRESASESAVEILERRYLRHPPPARPSSHVSDVAPLPLPILADPTSSSRDASNSSISVSASASVSTVGQASICSAVSARSRRQCSASRSHALALEGVGRIPSLRVKTMLGRSPSRRGSRSTVSNSSGGLNVFLPAPQPAMLQSPFDAGRISGVVAAPPAASAHARRGSTFHRSRSDRSTNPRGVESTQQRDGAPGTDRGASSGQFSTATCGTCDPNPGTAAASQADTSSPGMSLSISRLAEPASEVQRLISELSAQGNDQLVILEPIGQGGYGTVYRGIWRNLDVAVKTVLFQDRATLSPAPSPLLIGGESASSTHTRVVRSSLMDENGDAGKQAAAMLLKGRRSTDAACAPSKRISCGGRQLSHASNLRSLALGVPAIDGHCTAPAIHAGSPVLMGPGGAGNAAGGGGDAGGIGSVCGNGAHRGWFAGQPPTNSNSLPNVSMAFLAGGCGAPPAVPAPLGVASQQRAVLEAAVSCSVAHPNVVATYHYDITPVQPTGVVCSGGLHVSDGKRGFGIGAAGAGWPGGGGAVMRDWKLYLVQEFCDGGSLATALDLRVFHDPSGLPNLALTLCALADITRGMAHIHIRSIVHGDLNPTNILLRSVIGGSTSGIQPLWHRVSAAAGGGAGNAGVSGAALVSPPGGGAGVGGSSGCSKPGGAGIAAATALRHELGVSVVAKVADFGLCGMLAPGKRHISNALRGTPFYTSPETVATGTLTKASDVYSFGVIAWEVYTGRPPFRHTTEAGFVRDDNFPRMPPHAPPTFAKMVAACLATDPEARPTFEQILDRLMHLQSKLAVSLHQRLSRLVGGNSVLHGTPSFGPPAPPATATNSPLVSAQHCGTSEGYGPGGSGYGSFGVGRSDGMYGPSGQGVGGMTGGSHMGNIAQAAQMPCAPVVAHTATLVPPGAAHGGVLGGCGSTGGPDSFAPVVAAHYTVTVTAPMASPVLGG